LATAVLTQPEIALQLSVVHGLPSSQLGGVPAVQTPAWQVSSPLHTLASGHGVPFATAACWHPLTGLHVSFVHGFRSSQEIGEPGVQMPEVHVSSPLHTLPSEHVVPFATTGFWHTPALQTSFVHGFESLQSAGTLHDWQPAIGVWMQPLSALQESVVQALPSSQLSGVPAEQSPVWHVSLPLHTVPSAHEVPFATATCWQPTCASQESVVHGF
jgi:hypothetical protein